MYSLCDKFYFLAWLNGYLLIRKGDVKVLESYVVDLVVAAGLLLLLAPVAHLTGARCVLSVSAGEDNR